MTVSRTDFFKVYIPMEPLLDTDEWDCNFCLEKQMSVFIDPCGHGNCSDCIDKLLKDPVIEDRAVIKVGGSKECTLCQASIAKASQLFYSIKKKEALITCALCEKQVNLKTAQEAKGPPVISKICIQTCSFFLNRRVGHIFHQNCLQKALDSQISFNKVCPACPPLSLAARRALADHHIQPLYHDERGEIAQQSRYYFLNEIGTAIATVGYLILMVGFIIANSTTSYLGIGGIGIGAAGIALGKRYYGATIFCLATFMVTTGLILQVSTTAIACLATVGAVALAGEIAYATVR